MTHKVRFAALLLLGGVVCFGQSPAECRVMREALTAPSADARERAARTLYRRCPADTTTEMRAALQKSVELGNANAAALLLLGRFADPETRAFLEQRVAEEAIRVKLDPWQKPVALGLAAAASAGSEKARARLRAGLGPLDEAEFLTSVLPAIRDKASLTLLLALLSDERTVATGVPSGASPRRRIQDLAVDGFVSRFGLTSLTVRASDRYTRAELDDVRRQVQEKGR